MPGYRVEFLSRDGRGRFSRFSRRILADGHDEAREWALHRFRNGRSAIESAIETIGPDGSTETHCPP